MMHHHTYELRQKGRGEKERENDQHELDRLIKPTFHCPRPTPAIALSVDPRDHAPPIHHHESSTAGHGQPGPDDPARKSRVRPGRACTMGLIFEPERRAGLGLVLLFLRFRLGLGRAFANSD
jgi:hypothetical protein